MPNPFYNRFQNQQSGNPFNNPQNIIQRFNQFRQQFQGDPREQVQKLLDSGKMSQEQFNQLSNMAKMYQNLFS